MSEQIFTPPAHTLNEANFVNRFGGVYEHSPWIAQQCHQNSLSEQENTPAGLSEALQVVVAGASREQLMALINAHPDLAGKAAVQGTLTAESTSEQSSAGIDQCSAEEFERFQRFNTAYKDKFGFPFIMAVKGSNRHLILAAFEERLEHDAEAEYQRAISEINKIARFRLDAIAAEAEG